MLSASLHSAMSPSRNAGAASDGPPHVITLMIPPTIIAMVRMYRGSLKLYRVCLLRQETFSRMRRIVILAY